MDFLVKLGHVKSISASFLSTLPVDFVAMKLKSLTSTFTVIRLSFEIHSLICELASVV